MLIDAYNREYPETASIILAILEVPSLYLPTKCEQECF